MSKHYSSEEAKKMIPYVKSFCKDIKKYHVAISSLVLRLIDLSSLTSLDGQRVERIEKLKNRIRDKVFTWNKRMTEWQAELGKMHIGICDISTGRVNIPVYESSIESIILYCVLPETTEKTLEWHFKNESYEDARVCLEKVA